MTQPGNQRPGWWQPPGGEQPQWQAPAPGQEQPQWQPPGGERPQWQAPGQGQAQWSSPGQGQPPWQPPGAPAPQWQEPQQWQQPQWGQGQVTPGPVIPGPVIPAQPGGAYGGFGAFDPGAASRPKRFRKPWLLGAAVLVTLCGGGVTAWQLGTFSGDVLDQQSVQNGVATVLREDFGESDVRDVRCPPKQPVRTGTTFDCSVTVAGAPKKVSIRVLNDQPQFEVGAPK